MSMIRGSGTNQREKYSRTNYHTPKLYPFDYPIHLLMSKYVYVEDLRVIPISDFLARLGYHPVRKSGKELFYHSMLRETKQNTPSLTAWDEGGKWLDRGGPNATGVQGGGIVQLGLAYWPQLSFVEVLNKI